MGLLAPGAASAKAPPPTQPNISGVAEYVETFPTSSGGRVGAAGETSSELSGLSGGAVPTLQAGSSASPRAGATGSLSHQGNAVAPARVSAPAPTAALAATTGAFGRRGIVFALVLVILTVVAFVIRRARRR